MTNNISLEEQCRFTTERLLVESWKNHISNSFSEREFANKIVNMLTDEVTKSLPEGWQGIHTEEGALAWLKERTAESVTLAVQRLPDKELVGFVFLYASISSEGTGYDLKLGYLLSQAVWGKGLGSELIQGLVEWCANAGDIRSISGGVEVNNIASIKILEKNGFRISTTECPSDNMVFLERKFQQPTFRDFQ